MIVSDIMITISPLVKSDNIGKAVATCLAANVDIVPVVDGQDNPTGAVTQKALLTALQGGAQFNQEIGFYVDWHIPRVSVGDKLINLSDSVIPAAVVNNEGAIVGVITADRFATAINGLFNEFREQMTAALNSAQEGIVAISEHGLVIFANRICEEMLGITLDHIIGHHIRDNIPQTRLLQVMKEGKPLTGQKFVLGNTPIMVNYAPITRDGKIVGAVSIFQDLSRIEEISNELGVVKGLIKELEAIIQSSYDGIWITDGQGVVLHINEAYERITGIMARDVVGKTMQQLVDLGFFDESVTLLVMKKLDRITINQTVKGKKKILVTGNPIFDEQGNLFRVVTNVRDVTELVNLQDQLFQEKEMSSKYKTELNHLRSMQIQDSDLIFRSLQMRQIYDLALKIADVDSTVLITGDSGTGKELIAKLIHRQGKDDESPFININCAAIPEQLLESELFGYEGGAFTGAKKEGKPGLFELANTGTLFLDEIGELPLSLQVKLLRAIQEREVFRVGGTKAIPINVRIVAATNKDLKKMVTDRLFREDLYYRLMVVPIHVPPLRERNEDIPLLVRRFVDELNSHFGYNKAISPQVLDKLVNYPWPGNVRELRNAIERMIVMSQGDEITLDDLPGFIYVRQPLHRHGARLKDAVIEAETNLLSETYRACGSWQEVAKILGVDRATVFRKASKYRLLNRQSH